MFLSPSIHDRSNNNDYDTLYFKINKKQQIGHEYTKLCTKEVG